MAVPDIAYRAGRVVPEHRENTGGSSGRAGYPAIRYGSTGREVPEHTPRYRCAGSMRYAMGGRVVRAVPKHTLRYAMGVRVGRYANTHYG
eukprot:306306-Rhodomonas_salina.2